MCAKMDLRGDKETPVQSVLGRGRFIRGKWYCECEQAARCLTAKKSSPNKGKRFWRCHEVNDKQCLFFLWVEHEAAAKEWLNTSQLSLAPRTPTKTNDDLPTISGSKEHDSLPQLPETPFTKAKRKRVFGDIAHYNDNVDSRSRNLASDGGPTMTLEDPFVHSCELLEHARKVARTPTVSTPGRHFTEMLRSRTVSLPTPNSRDHMSADNMMASQPRLLPSRNTSPTPGRFNNRASLNPEGESDLIATVLELIRSDGLELEASTELQLRHEIGLVLDVGRAKVGRYQETITELRKRLDEVEKMVLHLTA
ncbi:uncharacterized protein PAC_15998 [Phialocephala subalpina]|uniref:GRF-type domain-containing protein n=1 Tax=Phialocephala subalpina TaxID=576137 RepID=A0A1L7XMD3_9HELO|nr:uncharacterized protein PAC_15998 [Phialocephala subalpina]